ncbi:MAG: VOC family protein [Anaerolineae bacterium]|nr:VOC family protein [Anaerolineae bacterium]
MQAHFKSAVIFVKAMDASRQFYEDLLGQEVEMDFGPNVGYRCGLALWQVDHACQTIYQCAPEAAGPLGRDNLELYFEADDLDALWAQLAAADTPVAHPICEQPWAQRVGRVYDPDGHIVEVAEPMTATLRRLLDAGMTAAAVAERTSMPLAAVMQVAGGGA